MTLAGAMEFIVANYWRQSTSARYKAHPHQYVWRDDGQTIPGFFDFVRYIRKHGFAKNFFKAVFIYCKIGDWYYWTMGWPVEETNVINRAKTI